MGFLYVTEISTKSVNFNISNSGINDSLWSKISPVNIIVFKYGKNKHTWNDKTEILVELTVFGEESHFKKATNNKEEKPN